MDGYKSLGVDYRATLPESLYAHKMGRPPLGSAGRTTTGSTKLTTDEARWLTQRDGTIYLGLRRALDLYRNTHGALAEPDVLPPATTLLPGTVHTQAPLTGVCRIHDYGPATTFMDKGQPFTRKSCLACGYQATAVGHQ